MMSIKNLESDPSGTLNKMSSELLDVRSTNDNFRGTFHHWHIMSSIPLGWEASRFYI